MCMYAATRIWQRVRAPPSSSFRRFSTTAASCGIAEREHWLIWQLARANALQSTKLQGADADAARVRALAACKDFLPSGMTPIPDIPILKEAKAEYAKLQ